MALVSGVLVASAYGSGCGQSRKVSKNDDHLTKVLSVGKSFDRKYCTYIHEQFPDQDIEFIISNNDDYTVIFKEHDELPDITQYVDSRNRCTQDLQPYLMDLLLTDVVFKYYSYAVQYY